MVIQSCLTIVLDSSFYKAILEYHDDNSYSVASVTLGSSEPKMSLILKLVNQNYQRLNFHHESVGRRIVTKKSIQNMPNDWPTRQ